MTKAATHSMNRRKQMPEGIEVRYHDNGTVDEIVVRDRQGTCLLHMEQMTGSRFWIGLIGYSRGEYPIHVDIYTDGTMVTDGDDAGEARCQEIFARVRV